MLSACTATSAAIGKRVFPNGMPEVWQEQSETGRYDHFRQLHTWSLAPTRLDLISSRLVNVKKLEMSVTAISKQTDSVAQPSSPSITLLFISSSSEWRYLKGERSIILIVDGDERINFGDAAYDGAIQDDGSVVEYLTVALSAQQLKRIGAAKRVDGQVGIVQFTLDPKQIDKVSTFAERLPGAP